jgi:ABC-type nitrate/sulfonate/bicarbonate transport system permease component
MGTNGRREETTYGRWARFALQCTGIAVLAAVWQIASLTNWLPQAVAPSFTQTISALYQQIQAYSFWAGTANTFRAWGYGMLVSSLLGIPLGLLLGSNKIIYRLSRPTIEAVRPIPPIVILPVVLVAVGYGFNLSALLITQGAMWPLLIMTSYGVATVPQVALDTATVFQFSFFRRLFFVRLAQALPLIGSGIRLAAAIAFAVSIMAGLVGGAPGLGQLLGLASQANDLPTLFALTVAIGFYGVIVISLFSALERRLNRWKVTN